MSPTIWELTLFFLLFAGGLVGGAISLRMAVSTDNMVLGAMWLIPSLVGAGVSGFFGLIFCIALSNGIAW